MSEVIISRGTVHFGMVRKDKDGNTISETPARFEEDDSTRLIIIGKKNEDFTPIMIDNIGLILEELGSRIGFDYSARFKEHNYFDGDISWECTGCKGELYFTEGTPEEKEYKFCPYCGRQVEIG